MEITLPGFNRLLMEFGSGFGIMAPVILFIYLRNRRKCAILPFIAGIVAMLGFAFGLEQFFHALILSSPLGPIIQNNLVLYALYGGLAAGIFEELGRWVAFRFVLKDEYRQNDRNALMYGAGHGGVEMILILTVNYSTFLFYFTMIESGGLAAVTQGMDAAAAEAFTQQLTQLAQSSPLMFIMAMVERISAMLAQLGLSVLVWFSLGGKGTGNHRRYFFLAVLLHAALDAVSVLAAGLISNIQIVEIIILVLALGVLFIAKRVWTIEHDVEQDRKLRGVRVGLLARRWNKKL